MKGRNEFHISQATMREAMQHYLDTQFALGKAPTVTHVKRNNDGFTGGAEHFIIETDAPEQERRT